ncbi:MAG: DUF1573 domain-containing protein [Planctomycetota bacterium]|nr:DUF1573 domain-containing protein [Planctomycetota bacterium]
MRITSIRYRIASTHHWVAFLLLTITALGGCGDKEKGPLLQGTLVKDFGVVQYAGPDMAVAHTFTFTNTTKRTLQIAKISSSCGCVTPVASTKTLEPGAALEIVTAMKLLHPGKKKEHITIIFESEDDPIKMEMIAYGRVVMSLKSEESEVTVARDQPGTLTLLAETSASMMRPLDPYWPDLDGLLVEFQGWRRVDEDDESSTSWMGTLNLSLVEDDMASTNGSDDETNELVVTIGQHNELRVPVKVLP